MRCRVVKLSLLLPNYVEQMVSVIKALLEQRIIYYYGLLNRIGGSYCVSLHDLLNSLEVIEGSDGWEIKVSPEFRFYNDIEYDEYNKNSLVRRAYYDIGRIL